MIQCTALKYFLSHHNTIFFIYNVLSPTIVKICFEHTFYFCQESKKCQYLEFKTICGIFLRKSEELTEFNIKLFIILLK